MDTSRYPGPTVFQAHSTIYKTTFDQPRVMVANNLPHKSVDATIFIIMGAPKGHDNCFVNGEADRILERYRRTFDANRRILLYRRLQEILYEEQPCTFIFVGRSVTAYSKRFRGVNWYPSGRTDYLEWWVPQADRRYP